MRANPDDGRLQVTLTPTLKRKAVRQAILRGMTLTAYISSLIHQAPVVKKGVK